MNQYVENLTTHARALGLCETREMEILHIRIIQTESDQFDQIQQRFSAYRLLGQIAVDKMSDDDRLAASLALDIWSAIIFLKKGLSKYLCETLKDIIEIAEILSATYIPKATECWNTAQICKQLLATVLA